MSVASGLLSEEKHIYLRLREANHAEHTIRHTTQDSANAAHLDSDLTLISDGLIAMNSVLHRQTIQRAYLETPQHDFLLHIVHADVLGAAAGQQEGSVGAEGQRSEALPRCGVAHRPSVRRSAAPCQVPPPLNSALGRGQKAPSGGRSGTKGTSVGKPKIGYASCLQTTLDYILHHVHEARHL